jgi:hypothetical protein
MVVRETLSRALLVLALLAVPGGAGSPSASRLMLFDPWLLPVYAVDKGDT